MDKLPTVVIPARYPELYSAARDVVVNAINLAQAAFPAPFSWPSLEGQEIIFEGTRSYLAIKTLADFNQVIRSVWEKLIETDEYKAAMVQLEKLASEERMWPGTAVAGLCLSKLLHDYFKEVQKLEFQEIKFRTIYYRLEDYLSQDILSCHVYCRLDGLQGVVDKVALSDSHWIQKLNASEINRIWRILNPPDFPGVFRSPWGADWPQNGSYILATAVRYPKSRSGELSVIVSEEESKCKRAFRLSTNGSGVISFWTYEDIGFVPSFGRFGFSPSPKSGQYTFPLDETSADKIKTHWTTAYELASTLQTVPQEIPSHLRISSLRLSGSYERQSDEDRLIDFAIALEAMFTKENDAISYRLPLRAAIFMGNNPAERKEIFSLLRAAYEQRNQLAHGLSQLDQTIKVGGKKLLLVDLLEQVRSVIFGCIHKVAVDPRFKTKEKFLNEIDNAIIGMDRNAFEYQLQASKS